MTCAGRIVNLALSVWLDSHCWSPGTTPVTAVVVGTDKEVERASGREWAEEDPSLAVARAVDVDGDAVVVAVAAGVESRLAVREASLEPDAVCGEHDT